MIPVIPQSPTAQAAAHLAAEAAPAFLLNHSYRTYLFGRCIVATPEVDEEAAFVAAMIHDLGLTDTYDGESEFARIGADLACRFLEARGWDTEKRADGIQTGSTWSRRRSCGTRTSSPRGCRCTGWSRREPP